MPKYPELEIYSTPSRRVEAVELLSDLIYRIETMENFSKLYPQNTRDICALYNLIYLDLDNFGCFACIMCRLQHGIKENGTCMFQYMQNIMDGLV